MQRSHGRTTPTAATNKAQIEQTLGQAVEDNSSLESELDTSQKERDELASRFHK
jgi:hypothetical protein